MSEEDQRVFEELEQRLKTLLPLAYQESYEDVAPVSMGSAGLRYGADGKVAWNEMWGSFCDLAMAGGPPHKGLLLEPSPARDVEAQPERYAAVVAEICRGITMVTDLYAGNAAAPGWVRVECLTRIMAAWLVRAITMENVAVRSSGLILELPAGPAFRVEKEIKNVITAIAKTAHYWTGHMSVIQRRSIAGLLDGMSEESPLVEPAYDDGAMDPAAREEHVAGLAATIQRETGLRRAPQVYADWLGLECSSVRAAIWMMRMLVAVNVVARREGTALFVPVNPIVDSDGELVASAVSLIHRLAAFKGVL